MTNWLKEHLSRMENKIDKLDPRLDSMDVTLAKQSVILEDHTRRSLANEEAVELLKKKLEADVKPLQNHVAAMTGVLKSIGVLASIASIVYTIIEAVKSSSR